jgi:hypothetical protein
MASMAQSDHSRCDLRSDFLPHNGKVMRAPRSFQLRSTILVAALGCAAVACGSDPAAKKPGADPDHPDGSGGTSTTTGGAAATGGSGPVTPGMTVGGLTLASGNTPTARLHRLTTSELQHSLQDLLGDGIPLNDLDPDNVVAGFASIGAGIVTTAPAAVSLYESAMRAATDYVFADPARLSARVACVPMGAADTACLDKVVAAFGRRAFRRPLTDAEIMRFTTLATTIASKPGSTISAGTRSALNAILQSPSFLYRAELGVASAADGGKLKYTDFEMASRLAATLWDSVPDDALLDAAAAGKLQTPDGVKAEASRLLADAKSHRAIRAFADELYGMSRFGEAVKDPAVFPKWSEALKPDMQQELELRIEDMVFTQKGDFLSLYDSRVTFVNGPLAAFYGLPAPQGSGFQRAELPADSPRIGLLGSSAFLAGHALPSRTSPTQRGKFVAEALFCRTVPPPPNNVPPLPTMFDQTLTLRKRLEAHRSAPQCAGCHGLMDPMGFGMENFDGIGQPRTMDGTSPVDATGTLTGDGLDGSSFNGLAELGAALRKQPIMAPCLVSKLYAEAQGREAIELDRPAIDALTTSFKGSQNHLDELIVALVAADSFRFVEPSKG